ncbi:hypothetical protein BURC_02109 [Burkholderiaceae bacterium]|nr:hypothetical protein BURC_02109 [Burkholderiaceae bacterium]
MTATVPFKTPLGHDELRARTLKLGQRHRTILFLIDGKRPLSEVLSLALQAGAATHHFEDLLRLGLVELPPEPQPAPADEALARPIEEDRLTTVELVVPEDEADEGVTVRAPLELPVPAQPPAATELDEAAQVPAERPAVVAPMRAMPPTLRHEAIPALPELPALPVLPVLPVQQAVAPRDLDIDLPLPNQAEAELLQQVRELLTEALRLDAPLFSARTFMRVRNAQSAGELIDLVWEIQDHLSHKRRSRKEMQSLQRARELLGLGNTLVDENSTRPPYFDE